VEEKNAILVSENARIYLKWEEEKKLRIKEQHKPTFGNPIAWGIAGAEAGVIIALILAMALGG